MLTEECKEIFVLKLYELYIDKAMNLSNKLKYGKKLCPCDKILLILANWGIDILCNYEAFEEEPNFIYSFEFIRTDSDSVEIEIVVGSDTFTGTSSNDANSFANLFQAEFEGSTNYDFTTLVLDNVLYVWSESPSNTTPVVSIVQSADRTNAVEVTNLLNEADTILNLQNCITYEEFCSLKNKLFDLLETNCSC